MAKEQPTKSLFERIKEFLKMGDDGRVLSFFQGELRKIERGIKTRKKDIEVQRQNLETEIEDLEAKLEDALLAMDNAYMNVQPDKLGSNAEREEFSKQYWAAINKAEADVKNIREQIKAARERVEDSIKTREVEISDLEAQKAKIGQIPD